MPIVDCIKGTDLEKKFENKIAKGISDYQAIREVLIESYTSLGERLNSLKDRVGIEKKNIKVEYVDVESIIKQFDKEISDVNNSQYLVNQPTYKEIENQEIRIQNKQLERKIPIFTKKDLESNKKAQESKRAFENYSDILLPLSANYQDLLVLMDYISNGEVLDKLPYNLIEEDYSVTELDIRNLISKYERALDRLEVVDSNLRKLSTNKTENISNFTGNFEYLSTDFVSDFYIDILKEREKNSEIYKNFYSNFDVNEKGIYLKNNDPITLSQVKEYADENLKQYSIISKQLPLLIEQETHYNTKQSRRDNIINNPQNINKYQGQFHKINDNNVIVKNSEDEFIKVYGEIYEAIDTEGNLTLYSRLDKKNDSEYYSLNNKAPKTDVKIEDYSYLNTQPEKFLTEKKYLSKSAKEKIKEEDFNCNK